MATTHRRCIGGCDFAVDPDLRSDQASLIWSPHIDSGIVLLGAAPNSFDNAHSIQGLAPSYVRTGSDAQYRIVEVAGDRQRIALVAGATAAQPLAAVIPLDANFAARTEATLRLWRSLMRRPGRDLRHRLTPQRRQRLILTLRALDGRLAGDNYREIARGLFGGARVPAGPSWKTHDLRDRTIRLVRTGTKLMQGGYLDLLRSPKQP